MYNEPAVAEQNKHFMTLRGPAFDLPSLHLKRVPGSPGTILAYNLPRVRWALTLPQPQSQRIGLLEGKKIWVQHGGPGNGAWGLTSIAFTPIVLCFDRGYHKCIDPTAFSAGL